MFRFEFMQYREIGLINDTINIDRHKPLNVYTLGTEIIYPNEILNT